MTENEQISVIVPVYNEERNLPTLVERLAKTFETNNVDGKIIVVSDGSEDETRKVALELAKNHSNLRILSHRTRKGKSAALHTGFMNASGDILAMIDADLQYAPEDLPKLVEKIRQGYDVVNGWRKHRHDSIFKKIASSVYNRISRISFGLRLHDFNSGLKMFKREVIQDLNLRKGQHRFILHLAQYEGYRVGEVEIQHFRRRHGKTKFGTSRMFWGLFDLISLRLQLAFTERPMALFGLSGIILSFLGFVAGAYVIALRILFSEPFGRHFALLLLSTFLLIAGIQSFLFGFIADMIADLKSERERQCKS